MSKRLKRKVALVVIVEFLFLLLAGKLLVTMQTDLSVSEQNQNIQTKLDEMDELVANADVELTETTHFFDEDNQGKAGSVAFMYQNKVLDGYTPTNMQQMKTLLDVHNIMILDRSGKVLAQAEHTLADFKRDRYNQLFTTFDTKKPSKAFEVRYDDQSYRYYGVQIDDEAMVVVEEDPKVLNERLERTSTWKSILEKVTVGLDGFAFAVSARDYTFLYYPDESIVGQESFSMGLGADNLSDGKCSWMTVNGQKLYGGVRKIDDVYIVCAITEEEILASQSITIITILFSIFVLLTLVVTYAFFIFNSGEKKEEICLLGKIYHNKMMMRKLLAVSCVGLVCVLGVAFYMQTIFSLSRQSMSNDQRVTEIETTVNQYGSEQKVITKEYDACYLNKTQIAAFIVSHRPEVVLREKLAELSKILSIEAVYVFNDKGVQFMTNSSYTVFELSKDPEEQSYDFWQLLHGADSLIQKAQYDDSSGRFHQFIGVSIRDEDAIPTGFVQISVVPKKLKDVLDYMDVPHILDNTKVGNKGIVFALKKKDSTFVYHPVTKLIGRDAKSYGLTEKQLTDEYTGFLNVNGKKYYASCLEIGDYYVYAAELESAIGGNRLPLTVTAGGVTLVALVILIMMLTMYRKTDETEDGIRTKEKKYSGRVDVQMPGGAIKRTTSAENRWQLKIVKWDNKNPEQKFVTVLKLMLGVFAVGICIAVLMKDKFFDSNSVFLYVMDGKWARGVNIFAVTGSLLIICVLAVITMSIQYILTIMARASGAKGETVCRLLKSLVKYISVIIGLYYCLAMMGIDTATLLASAGIMTLVIGLGAQTLVSDILAGLFIIFEGEFQVGDIVTIGDWRGTVVDIGIRTTKIKDGLQNIKVISNSSVSGVINMTREYSFCSIDVGIEYGESLERVESILEKEFPNLREHIPAIKDGPFYKGVSALADNSVNLRIMVLCEEADRFQVERDLYREIKLLFDQYEISIPFPQVVLNQPVESKKATEWEKMKAQKFNEAQKELSANLGLDEDNDED